ncbi:MAG: ThiF family adenylyltransferase [Nanoarchaeota archaeon]
MTDETSRYDRLVLGWGPESQEKVSKSIVTVVTDGYLGKYSASYLASAGFGNIRIVSGERLRKGERFLWGIELNDEGQAKSYSQALMKLNPQIRAVGIGGNLDNDFAMGQIKRSDVIVDVTNSPRSKAWSLSAADKYGVPAVSASCSRRKAKLMVFDPRKQGLEENVKKEFMMGDFSRVKQDELTALGWAGVVDEEVKKFILGEDKLLDRILEYEFSYRPAARKFRQYKALVIGAGSAGNKAIPALAKMGFGRIDVVDMDKIETSNYPRTEYFVDRDGDLKVEVIMEQMRKIYPRTKFRALFGEFNSEFESGVRYDVVLDLVDNDYSRGEVYKYAMEHGSVHLSVGIGFSGYNTALAIPGKTACMEHCYPGFMEQAAADLEMIRYGCERNIPSNSWMQGGTLFGVLHIPTAFFPESGDILNGSLYYDANMGSRIAELKVKKVCSCWGGKD